jgi:hypothetical protein
MLLSDRGKFFEVGTSAENGKTKFSVEVQSSEFLSLIFHFVSNFYCVSRPFLFMSGIHPKPGRTVYDAEQMKLIHTYRTRNVGSNLSQSRAVMEPPQQRYVLQCTLG